MPKTVDSSGVVTNAVAALPNSANFSGFKCYWVEVQNPMKNADNTDNGEHIQVGTNASTLGRVLAPGDVQRFDSVNPSAIYVKALNPLTAGQGALSLSTMVTWTASVNENS